MPLPRKLSDDQVREIRDSEQPNTRLAAQYGVDRRVIQLIKRHYAYQDVSAIDLKAAAEAYAAPRTPPPNNEYVLADDLSMLEALPERYAETIVTAASRDYGDASQRLSPRRQEYGLGYAGYVDYHQAVISECLRVAGPGGVVFFHVRHRFNQKNLEMNTWDDLVNPFPLCDVITWEHSAVARDQIIRPMQYLPQTADYIYVFAGDYWHIPAETQAGALYWGEVWQVDFYQIQNLGRVPPEVARRFVALGRGRVLTFAGFDDVALAAIRQRRDWLLVGQDPHNRNRFERLRWILEDDIRLHPYQKTYL